jgi:general secretion pathway protein C
VAGLAILATKIVWLVIVPGGAMLGQHCPCRFRESAEEGSTRVSWWETCHFSSRRIRSPKWLRPVEDVQEAPETKLNLVLKGVRASADGTGVAMIVMPNNRLSIFAPGETILDGVVLDRVVWGSRDIA